MKNIVSSVIEIDKEARLQIETLKKEKEDIGNFIKSEKKKIIDQYNKEMNEQIEITRNKVKTDIDNKKQAVLSEYNKSIESIENNFKENKDKWVELIYQYCIEK